MAASIGVTLIPSLAARRLHPGVALLRLDAPPARHVTAHRLDGTASQVVAAAMDALAVAARAR